MGRGPDVCPACYRHVCAACGWYKVLARAAETATCYRCQSADAVERREVAHSGWNVCPFSRRLGAEAVRGRCQFCERERDMRFLIEADGQLECKAAARCATYQRQHG